MEQTKVGEFEIPEELAKQLSDLLTKQIIRERSLDRLVQQGDEAAIERAEERLAPVVEKVEAIKVKITNEFVPKQYASAKYVWNYNGWEVSENRVDVLTA